MLADVGPGDEVLIASFSDVSVGNAVVRSGAKPVFFDMSEINFGLDTDSVLCGITDKTKAIIVNSYLGDLSQFLDVYAYLKNRGIVVIENADHCFGSRFREKPLGAYGDLSTLSFHETQPVTCGEGGALIVNDKRLLEAAVEIRNKGTDRALFIAGQVDKYTWTRHGSAFMLGELCASFLAAQLSHLDAISTRRQQIYRRYKVLLDELAQTELISLPRVSVDTDVNGALFPIQICGAADRENIIPALARAGIGCVSHYEPLHLSKFGSKVGRASPVLSTTEKVSSRLLRLPTWPDMRDSDVDLVARVLSLVVMNLSKRN
jgi:dTDP-4-amino-4,6-dideoxygalactose transaminase